jgi:mycofactocin biosynthetic radical S-adenosylmethionine protein MftC
VITTDHPLSAPVNVTWEITDRCNLKCSHCLSADLMEKSERELDFDQVTRVIDDLDHEKVFQINFGGGEPFLRKDFLSILDYAHTKGITTCVSTNGTLLTDDLAKRLSEMDLLYIQVSLDGATEATNEMIRGKGTYRRIMEGIGTLLDAGFPHLSTNTVVTRLNMGEIIDIYELGMRLGVKTRLSRFRPSGNARKVWEEYRLTAHQLKDLSVFLSAHRDVLTGDSFFSITSEERRDLGLNMCGAAKMTLSVSPDGWVYPCAFLQEPGFLCGNITRDPLRTIWNHAAPLKLLREVRKESCDACERFSLCHGGCPAVAFYLTRSLAYADPECMSLFKESTDGVPCHV